MEEASPGGGGLEVGGVYQLVLALIVGVGGCQRVIEVISISGALLRMFGRIDHNLSVFALT
jgi:hypothetical protein